MRSNLIFVDRRKGNDRREKEDSSGELDADLSADNRRHASDRRTSFRSLLDDYYAYMKKQLGKTAYLEPEKRKKK